MYHYVEDKKFLSNMRNLCGEIMQDLCHTLKVEYNIGATFYLVGSGKRKLILQNANNPIDLDYNLEIVKCDDFENPREIKENVRKAFNSTLNSHGWNDCQDSTSSLTTEKRYFTEGNDTVFSIDICIVYRDCNNNYYRLIHEKTGFTIWDRYSWDKAPDSSKLNERVECIKSKSRWQNVRDEYLYLKNHYLKQNEHNHSSFTCYIEAVNNVYNSISQSNRRF